MLGRELGLEGLPNARCLGGHLTAKAGVVRRGALFRADSPSKATAVDVTLLDALGVTRVIDLRGEAEAMSFGPSLWRVDRVHLPVCDTGRDILTAEAGASVPAGTAEQTMVSMYRQFVTDDTQRQRAVQHRTRRPRAPQAPRVTFRTCRRHRPGHTATGGDGRLPWSSL
ncbi:MAG: protein-tyrosine phosphatase [Micromonosporaceae bacterium]|nr:protein-tyrosine phosphatase [Micromonosporaceae bacterium]